MDDALMADWNKDALDALKERLKENVIIDIGLGDKLNKAAGGFMNRGEVQSVQSKGSNAEQMAKLIEILQGKTNADFKIFCRILRDSNWHAWADELEREARKFRSQSGDEFPDGKPPPAEPPPVVEPPPAEPPPVVEPPPAEPPPVVEPPPAEPPPVVEPPPAEPPPVVEPKPQFAIITANPTEQNVVKHYLKLERPCGKVYAELMDYDWKHDSFLKEKNVKITANNPEDVYDVFTIGEVMGVHVKCTRYGPGGAQDMTSDLLKKASEEKWPLKVIFVVGCCGVSMSDAKKTQKNWRGTVLLSEQMEDYLDTAKALKTGLLANPRTYNLCGTWVKWLSDQSISQPALKESQGDIPVDVVSKYLSGPLVIKSEEDGKTYRGNCQMAGIEMEGARVYTTVNGSVLKDTPKVAVVKGISDYAGSDKDKKAKSVVFGKETAVEIDDNARQEIATLHAITLVTRCVAHNAKRF